MKLRTLLVTSLVVWIGIGISWAQNFDQQIDEQRVKLRQNSQDIDALLNLARYLSWSGRLEEASRTYKQVLVIKPGQVEAEIGLAAVFSWQKKYDEAIRRYLGVLKKYPDNVDALVGLARVYSWRGDYQKAVDTFATALKFSPGNRDVLLGLGRVYAWHKRYQQSEKVYQEFLDREPKDIEFLQGLANTYKWSEKYSKGIQIELKILEIEPKNVDSMLSIGYMYGQLGAIGQSVHWYEKASQIAPDRGDIQAHLGLLYTHNQQLDSAVTAFKKSIKLQETDIESYLSLGRVYSWQNKVQDAEKHYKRALEINPQSAGAYAGLGQLYFFNGLWDKSIQHYERALKIDPFYVEALQGLKRVKRVKAPNLTSRYDFLLNKYRDTLTNVRTNIEYVNRVSQEYIYNYAPGKAIEVRGRFAQTAFNNTDKDPNFDPESEDRDYLYNEYTASFRLDYPLVKDRLYFQGRFDQLFFKNHSNPHTFNIQNGDDRLEGGFALLRYEHKKWFSLVSVSREALVLTQSNLLMLDPLHTYASAFSYDATDHLAFVGSFFFQDFRKGRGFPDRREVRGLTQYRLPFLEEVEMAYEIRQRNHTGEVTHVASTRYTDRFFEEKFLSDLGYEIHALNASEDYGVTYKNIFKWFGSLKVSDWIDWNFDAALEIEQGKDRDVFHAYRTYLTFILDKDLMTGRYSVTAQ